MQNSTQTQDLVINTKETIDAQPLKDWAKSNNITQVKPIVGASQATGYPFLSFINGNNECTNIWFSKSQSESISKGDRVTKEMLDGMKVYATVNASGETRLKLSKSEGNRLDLSDLL